MNITNVILSNEELNALTTTLESDEKLANEIEPIVNVGSYELRFGQIVELMKVKICLKEIDEDIVWMIVEDNRIKNL